MIISLILKLSISEDIAGKLQPKTPKSDTKSYFIPAARAILLLLTSLSTSGKYLEKQMKYKTHKKNISLKAISRSQFSLLRNHYKITKAKPRYQKKRY